MCRFVKNLFVKNEMSNVDHAAQNRDDATRTSRENSVRAHNRQVRPSLEHLEERLTPGGGIWGG